MRGAEQAAGGMVAASIVGASTYCVSYVARFTCRRGAALSRTLCTLPRRKRRCATPALPSSAGASSTSAAAARATSGHTGRTSGAGACVQVCAGSGRRGECRQQQWTAKLAAAHCQLRRLAMRKSLTMRAGAITAPLGRRTPATGAPARPRAASILLLLLVLRAAATTWHLLQTPTMKTVAECACAVSACCCNPRNIRVWPPGRGSSWSKVHKIAATLHCFGSSIIL